MKKLFFILLYTVIFTSCQKEEFFKVNYKVIVSGTGKTEILIGNDTIVSDNFDTTFIIPKLKNIKYKFEYRVIHKTEEFNVSNFHAEIQINDVIEVERDINHVGCMTGNYLIVYRNYNY